MTANGWIRWIKKNKYESKQELSYHKQIARQLRTHFVEGISVTLKSTLRVTEGHWKRNHWTDHTRLTIKRVIGRWILSHTRTVVRECCKGDGASQWRSPKFDPHHAETPFAKVIKIDRGDYVVDPYTCAKVRHDPPRGVVSAHAWLCAPNCTPKGVSLFWVLATRYSQGPWTDFDAKYARTRGSVQGCAFLGSQT